jgi:hypothetical protein
VQKAAISLPRAFRLIEIAAGPINAVLLLVRGALYFVNPLGAELRHQDRSDPKSPLCEGVSEPVVARLSRTAHVKCRIATETETPRNISVGIEIERVRARTDAPATGRTA